MSDSDLTVQGPPTLADPPTPEEVPPSESGLEEPPAAAAQPARHEGRWQPPTPEQLSAQLPQYRIEGLLGRGGMGAVYRGVQESLHRPVAIKILPGEFSGSAEFVARFQREARVLARLQHPGIVAIYGFGQTNDGHLYIVMEYVDGADLQRILRGPGLHPAQASDLLCQICDALDYAHQQGVVHRDIKPANILVTKDGRAKLADFGLARPMSEDHAALTISGVFLGTPAYMAPEQREGRSDHRSDIFALGVLFYEMITRRRPEGVFEPMSARVPVDARFDEVVTKAMRHEPARRHQQVLELKQEVEWIGKSPPNPGEKTKPPSSFRFGSQAAFALLAALLIGIAGFAIWPKVSRRQTAIVAKPVAAEPFVNRLGMKFVPLPGRRALMCIHETRRADYAAFAAENADVNGAWKNVQVLGTPVSEKDDYPVVNVTWNEVTAFCAWLSAREGRRYRLPTDREWSVAVGIDTLEPENATPSKLNQKVESVFPWGARWPPPAGSGNFADATTAQTFPGQGAIAGYTDGFATTAPVMSFPPNKLGFYDLIGNTLEWCVDWFDETQQKRTMRGGGWKGYGKTFLLSSCRYAYAPGGRSPEFGFRCVMDLDGLPASSPVATPRVIIGGAPTPIPISTPTPPPKPTPLPAPKPAPAPAPAATPPPTPAPTPKPTPAPSPTPKATPTPAPTPKSATPPPTTPRATPPVAAQQKVAKRVPGKPGFVTSPYAPAAGMIDVRGFPPGTQVKDPYTQKVFLVPPP